MDDIEKVIEKVRKLLALAQSPNEHEAAAAMDKAQELLAIHNLDMTQVESEEAESSVTQDYVRTESVGWAWQRHLRGAVAMMYFCRYYFKFEKVPTSRRSCGYIRYDLHFYVGEKHNIEVAKLMSDYLVDAVIRLAKEGARDVHRTEKSRYIHSFHLACSTRLYARINERVRQARAGAVKTSDGRNLPALASMYDAQRAVAEAWLKDHGLELHDHNRQQSTSSERGHLDGREAGDSISLDQQIGGHGGVGHLIGKH